MQTHAGNTARSQMRNVYVLCAHRLWLKLCDNPAAMAFDLQPLLTGKLVELRPLRQDDENSLFDVASDPLIWEQHPCPHQKRRHNNVTAAKLSVGRSLANDNPGAALENLMEFLVGTGPRIHGGLLMLGFGVSERTISRWMKRASSDPDCLVLKTAVCAQP